MNETPKISIIITTYNWPEALNAVLMGLCSQQVKPDEVLIADDGSSDKTKHLIERWRLAAPFPIKHIWHEDNGFQAAKIRNRAIAVSAHPYLIFIDGDCVPLPNFIKNHQKLAETGRFIPGSRILLSEKLTTQCLAKRESIATHGLMFWGLARIKGHINRILPMLYLPLGRLRYTRSNKWEGAKTCNLAVWRTDAISVNGFDEQFTGWGYEDSDFVVRLLNLGAKRKEGRHAATVWHLWHPEASRAQAGENWDKFMARIKSKSTKADKGISQYV